jgi:hypothetical protein
VIPPLTHEGVALRNNGPGVFCEAFQPSSGPGGYLSPTVLEIEFVLWIGSVLEIGSVLWIWSVLEIGSVLWIGSIF